MPWFHASSICPCYVQNPSTSIRIVSAPATEHLLQWPRGFVFYLHLYAFQLPSIDLALKLSPLIRKIVWLHRDWATSAALLSFIFNLIGGGGLVRWTLICKHIGDISPPERLLVTHFQSFVIIGERAATPSLTNF